MKSFPLAAMAAFLVVITAVGTSCTDGEKDKEVEVPPVDTIPDEAKAWRKLQDLHNAMRTEVTGDGWGGLAWSTHCYAAAYKHAVWMAQYQRLQHKGKDGSSVWDRLANEKYLVGHVGENIAMGYRTPEQVMSGWRNSPAHYANIVNKNYDYMGAACAYDSQGVPYWCVVFASQVQHREELYRPTEPAVLMQPSGIADLTAVEEITGRAAPVISLPAEEPEEEQEPEADDEAIDMPVDDAVEIILPLRAPAWPRRATGPGSGDPVRIGILAALKTTQLHTAELAKLWEQMGQMSKLQREGVDLLNERIDDLQKQVEELRELLPPAEREANGGTGKVVF